MDDTAAVLDVNDQFYQAMREADLGWMADLWARDRTITCTHPGQPMLIGREPIMHSWRVIFGAGPTDIWPVSPNAVVSDGSAFVLVVERVNGVDLMASNGFVREDGVWRMVNHQASTMPAESPN